MKTQSVKGYMQVIPINRFSYINHREDIKQKNQTFGNLVPEEKYLDRLVNRASETEFNCVAELCEIPINLKTLLKYNVADAERKSILDRYFEHIPKKEIENLTVTVGCRDFYKKEEEYLAPATLTANLPNVNIISGGIDYKATIMTIMDRPDCYTPISEKGAWIPTNKIFDVLADKINEQINIFNFLHNKFQK